MNYFIHANIGFYIIDVYYTDTVYSGKKHWDKADKAGLVGKKTFTRKIWTMWHLVCSLFSTKNKVLFNY